MKQVQPSDIYLEAWVAAEKALPPDALKLIQDHDALHRAWSAAGWPSPIPTELVEAGHRVESHPLAAIAFTLRQQTNQAGATEYRDANPSPQVAEQKVAA
jgi:hypothetical protein